MGQTDGRIAVSLNAPSAAVASELWGQGGTLYPQVQDLYPMYHPSQRCGFRQNLKQTTLTTRLYKVRTNLLTKTFRHDCSVGCIITALRLTVAASKTLRCRHFRHQRSSTSPAPHGPMVDSLHCSMTTLSHTLPVNHNTLLLLTQRHTHTHTPV